MDDERIIDIKKEDGVVFVEFLVPSISAALDIEALAAELSGYIEDNKPNDVIVDFNGVKFFSSQVLGLLVCIWRKLKEYGGSVLISGINPDLNRVFRITNLDRLFEFYPDRQSAINAVKAR